MQKPLCKSPPKGTWPLQTGALYLGHFQGTAGSISPSCYSVLLHSWGFTFRCLLWEKCLTGVPSQHFTGVFWFLCEYQKGWNSCYPLLPTSEGCGCRSSTFMYLRSTSWGDTVWWETFLFQGLHFSTLSTFVNIYWCRVKAGSSTSVSLFPAHFVRNIFSCLTHSVSITRLGWSIRINGQLGSLGSNQASTAPLPQRSVLHSLCTFLLCDW